MMQVLFYIPFTSGFMPPDGVPIYGFGAMLFLTFALTAMIWGPKRTVKIGLSKDKLQDLAILLFLAGIAGARIVYMIQYSDQFPDKSLLGLVKAFFQIWNGGIVFYGSVLGGILGYTYFYRTVIRPLGISAWKLADALAPVIALGLAVGRIGCYLNGCCWGQPVCDECQTMPLVAELGQFPLLPAHARDQLCRPAGEKDRMPQIRGLQTSTGFAIAPRESTPGSGDPRSLIVAIEPGSAAAKAGLKPGDRIVGVNGRANQILVEVDGPDALVATALSRLTANEGTRIEGENAVGFNLPAAYRAGVASLSDLRPAGLTLTITDTLGDLVRSWPRGEASLELRVIRDGSEVIAKLRPKTIAFFPTQLYESVSMILLIFVILSFQPFQRHDGQLIVVLMLGYALHRFLNEAIRIEPTYALNLTLSQWISVGIFGAGLALELYLWRRGMKVPE